MGRSTLFRRAALLAGASSLLLAGAAAAQETPAPADAQLSLGKIVVTAGAEKVAIDTPQAVTTLDQDDIDQIQATTMADLLEGIPGVSLHGGVSALGQGFNIRGLGTGIGDSDSRVLLQVDGVTKFFEQYRMGSLFSEPELYKRVEVLRGPASSTLYGAGALAGVVSFQTKDASDFLKGDDRLGARLKAGYESQGDGRLYSAILAARSAKDLDVLVAYNDRNVGHYENGDGEVVYPSDAVSTSWLAKARYYIGGDKGHSVWASYQNWLSESTQNYDQAEAAFIMPVRRKVDDNTATLGYENDFGGSAVLDLSAQLSFADTTVEQRDTTFLGPLSLSEFSYRSVQGRIENVSRFGDEDWAGVLFVGVQGSKQERRNPRVNAATGAVTPGGATHPEGDMSRYGVYAQAEVMWREKLTLMPGVRVDWATLVPGAGAPANTPDEKQHGVSPKLAAIYSFNDTVAVFGSVARTVRLPVIDEVFSRRGTPAAVSLNLEPEISQNYEIGFTLSFKDLLGGDVAHVKTTAFRNDVTDLITRRPSPSPAGTSEYYNLGEARYEGVEIEAEYARGGFFGRAGYSTIEGTNELTGAALNTIPADELNTTAGYVFRDLGLTAGWRGEFAKDKGATDGYAVHSVFATWKPTQGLLKGVEVQVAVSNLTDEQFKRHLSALDAEGRNFKISVGRAF